ncbi:hypothetical protein [Enterococcus larvae]|uniref:hypothetical protein n=1 Tax=Enterococcus larvae TaxID=2794352 RepID=UPI003F2EB16B
MLKRLKKVLVGAGLGLLFVFPMGASADSSEFIHIGSNDLRGGVADEIDGYLSGYFSSKQEELNELLESGQITEAEYEAQNEAIEKEWQEEDLIINQLQLFKPSYMAHVKDISPDWSDPYTNIHGIEFAENLEILSGEFTNPVYDLRPVTTSNKLKELRLPIANQHALTDLAGLENLEQLYLEGKGFGTEDEEFAAEEAVQEELGYYYDAIYTQVLLTDVSALSSLNKLSRLDIYSEGALPVVTLRQGTTSYELVDPVILSSQFDGAEIEYHSYLNQGDEDYSFESNEEVKWEGLTGSERFLSFSFSVRKGNYSFDGEGQIPIRWK